MKRAIARRLLGGASAAVALSRWTAERAQRVRTMLGLEAGEVAVVPLGADPRRFRPEVDPEALRVGWDSRGRRWMLTVARLEPQGVDTGLRVLAALRTKCRTWATWWPAPDRSVRRSLRRPNDSAWPTGFACWARFPEADLPGLYRAATLYLGLSRELPLAVEGFGLAGGGLRYRPRAGGGTKRRDSRHGARWGKRTPRGARSGRRGRGCGAATARRSRPGSPAGRGRTSRSRALLQLGKSNRGPAWDSGKGQTPGGASRTLMA